MAAHVEGATAPACDTSLAGTANGTSAEDEDPLGVFDAGPAPAPEDHDLFGLFCDDDGGGGAVAAQNGGASCSRSPRTARRSPATAKRGSPAGARRPSKVARSSSLDKGEDATLEERIQEFAVQNVLEDRVCRILKNMIPADAERVLKEGDVPKHCTNSNAVVVARVRRIEKAAGRPNAMRRYDGRPLQNVRPGSSSPGRRSRSRGGRSSDSESRSRRGRGGRGRRRRDDSHGR